MDQYLQAAINGLLEGGLLALVAMGFSLVWGVMNIVNLAHGAFVILGAFTAWELHATYGVHPLIGLVVAAVVMFFVGYVVQRSLINLVINAPIWMTLLLTFGLELIIVNVCVYFLTSNLRSIQTGYASEAVAIGVLRVPIGRLVGFALAIVLTIALVGFMDRTKTGRAIRAAGMDRTTVRLMGVNVRHVYAITFAIATSLAAAAGALLATVGTFAPPDAGRYTLLSFVISVLGGLGNMWGALAGGLLFGVVQAIGGQLLSGTLINAIAFAVLLVVLVVRPTGLLGKPFYEARVEA